MSPPDLKFAFNLPPSKAIEYFEAKGAQITFDWREMLGEAHARTFTVTKAAQLDVLKDIHDMVRKALREGITLRQFQDELEPRLKAKGWWGKQQMTGPDGVTRTVQLGSPARLATIYRTNLQTAYMAGRWQDMIANAENRPYWQYVAVLDSKTRPAHRALNGKVFRYDDPFWKYFYPPNGWNCRCRVRAYNARDIEARGLKVESSEGMISELEVSAGDGIVTTVRQYRNPDTGATFTPDLGWDYNPGEAALWDHGGGYPDAVAATAEQVAEKKIIKMVEGQKTWEDYGRTSIKSVAQELRLPEPEYLPIGQNRDEALQIVCDALALNGNQPRLIRTPVEDVIIQRDLLVHFVEKERDARERFGNFILPTLEQPFEIYLTEYEDGFRFRYIGLFQGKNNLATILRINSDGSIFWNAFPTEDRRLDKMRVGTLIYQKD